MSADFDEGYGFCVSWFESDGCASCDIETVAVGFDAVEFELGVRFDEVVMGTNLRNISTSLPFFSFRLNSGI